MRPNNFAFSLVSEKQIFKYLNELNSNKSTGLDGIPARFVRDSAPVIASKLTHIINLSLIQGVVPDDLKSARIVPIFKKNDKTEVGNYRPVSILSVISKIFERVVYDQIENYLHKHNLLFEFQSGFRKGFSTETCLIHLSDFIRIQNDKGNLVGMVLLDLQKAFDTVDHSILLMKLKALGLSSDILNWFKSYLSDRQQLVDISGTFSSTKTVTCGVPQGSILGPLLFLIYVNDMSAVVKNKLLQYADDSAILVSGKDINYIENELTNDLNRVSNWLTDNKLSLHLGKTESVLFGPRNKLKTTSNINITCNSTKIKSTSSVKYLGATLDQFLSGDAIVTSIINKANSRLKFLYRKGSFLTEHTKKLLIMSLVQCHFDYACSFWYHGLSKRWKDKLQVTQNKLARFVLNLPHRSHIGKEQFQLLNWLPVEKRVQQIILCHVFKIKHGMAPAYLGERFITQETIHSYSTRFSTDGSYSIPKVKSAGSKSFLYTGCTLWNKIPSALKDITKLEHFKSSIKTHLLDSL